MSDHVHESYSCHICPTLALLLTHAGDAMVPLADIFNHKASIVALSDGYVVGELQDNDADNGEDEEMQEDVENSTSDSESDSDLDAEADQAVSGSDSASEAEDAEDEEEDEQQQQGDESDLQEADDSGPEEPECESGSSSESEPAEPHVGSSLYPPMLSRAAGMLSCIIAKHEVVCCNFVCNHEVRIKQSTLCCLIVCCSYLILCEGGCCDIPLKVQ